MNIYLYKYLQFSSKLSRLDHYLGSIIGKVDSKTVSNLVLIAHEF
jgi:hypothetical protein